ncbi:MAG: hypothetical protein MUE33_05625 [Cytophagaceae bacterium]|jgi:Tol biopolymer transport system component|nr:hypothetical protein [Cytophagaceae bacterium]
MCRFKRFAKVVLFIVLSSFYSNNSFSQEYSKRELQNLKFTAQYFFQQRNYHQALPLYQQLDSLSPHNPQYIYPLGICYINDNYDDKEALHYFQECLKNEKNYPKTLHFYLARCYHLGHNFDLAIQYYETYLSHLYYKKKQNSIEIKEIYHLIEQCKNGKNIIRNAQQLDIINLGPSINTKYPEYAPVLSADETELIFTTSRPETTGGGIDSYDGHYYEDIYLSRRLDSVWLEAKPIKEINTNGHDASISLTPDGQQLLIYKYSENSFGLGSGDLYLSVLNGLYWSTPMKLDETINTLFWEPSGNLLNDGNTIIFSSDKPGGKGGLDLYFSKKQSDGKWSLPESLGDIINTPFNEDSPYMHPDGKTLYFSSTGHTSMGGYDLFYSTYNDSLQRWNTPINMGVPINSAHDELHFSFTADGKRMYFAARKSDGYGDKDIYKATLIKEVSSNVLVVVGQIKDSIQLTPIGATIKVIDKQTNKIVGIYNSNQTTGKYIMVFPEGSQYLIQIESDKYKICDETVDTRNLNSYKEINSTILLCPDK